MDITEYLQEMKMCSLSYDCWMGRESYNGQIYKTADPAHMGMLPGPSVIFVNIWKMNSSQINWDDNGLLIPGHLAGEKAAW